ncbi:UNVERIFIED_CONTAM: hypothetical protein Sangu_0938900 [Sesamum angustifolium]|uniref:Uncharacterized protein n=1 Tax=Sesamum angustifolium TaxID=2727405 RepID=A0AAW2PG13_9LAMI
MMQLTVTVTVGDVRIVSSGLTALLTIYGNVSILADHTLDAPRNFLGSLKLRIVYERAHVLCGGHAAENGHRVNKAHT